MTDAQNTDRRADTTDEGALSPGSTATGGGTTEPDLDPATDGTTEADVSDGREQDPSVS